VGTAKANAGLTPAGKALLVDANRILEDCDASISKAQRISRGEIGELSIGYMSPLTHDFLGKASPGPRATLLHASDKELGVLVASKHRVW
jgi:DNA-binding transcriptional LysR family regulator